jgi:hypothetical protein
MIADIIAHARCCASYMPLVIITPPRRASVILPLATEALFKIFGFVLAVEV